MTAVGTRHVYVDECGSWETMPCLEDQSWVTGRVVTTSGPDVGQGVPGLTVRAQVGGFMYQWSALTDAEGRFSVRVDFACCAVDIAPQTWTAHTDATETHAASSASGVFVSSPVIL